MAAAVGTGDRVYDLAVRLIAAGIGVLPIRPDGSKAPTIEWKPYTGPDGRLASDHELRLWFVGRVRGIGAIGGVVSGGLECIDFDVQGLFERWADDVDQLAPGLLQRLVVVRTPGDGAHVWYRADVVEPNQILAKRPATEVELRAGKKKDPWRQSIETRGEGGQALIPGCPAPCHPTGKLYEYNPLGLGDLARVQRVTPDEQSLLLDTARALSTYADPPKDPPRGPANGSAHGITPLDDFDRRGTWEEVLAPHHWQVRSGTWEDGYLTRPGKDVRAGHSATVGKCQPGKWGEPMLFVFSTDAGMAPGRYGRGRAFAELNHGGDQSAAAAHLRAKGYGDPTGAGTNGHARNLDSNHPAAGPGTDIVVLETLDQVGARPPRWLVPGRIPRKVTLIASDGGMGKSTLVRHLVARVTTGRPAFDGPGPVALPPGHVLLLAAEDGYEDVVVPSLVAEGADLARVARIKYVETTVGGRQDRVHFEPRHLAALKAELARLKAEGKEVRLIVIDPIASYVGRTQADENKGSELRRVLDPLAELAEEFDVAVLIVAHVNKAAGAKAKYRVAGSAAYVSVARVAYVAGDDPDDESRKLLMPFKWNYLGVETDALAYRLRPLTPDQAAAHRAHPAMATLSDEDFAGVVTQMATLEFDAPVRVNVDEVMAAGGRGGKGGRKLDACVEWLVGFLATYAYPSKEVMAAGEKAGFGGNLVFSARKCHNRGRPDSEQIWHTNRGTFQGTSWWGIGDWRDWTLRPAEDAVSKKNPNDDDDEIPP